MSIGNATGETADRGRGGVHNSQERSGQEMATKSGDISLDLTGNLAVRIPEESSSERGESKRKGST